MTWTPTAEPRRALLLRHGQSMWNIERRWQGARDSPLSELGCEQAAWAAERLASIAPFDAVHTSDLGRAVETATIITTALGAEAARPDPRWREAVAGEWEGRVIDEIEREWPGWLAAHRRPPGFEPDEQVVARALAALDDLDPGHHLVVTHSGLVRALVRHHGGADHRVPNLGGVWMRHRSDGWRLDGAWDAPPSAHRRTPVHDAVHDER